MKSGRSSRRRAKLALYENPRLYDLAFSFRDIREECDGLLALARTYGLRAPRSVVEIACGPAHHLRELARRGIVTFGVDRSREMIGYAKSLAERDGVKILFRHSDMRSFRLPMRVDLALCLFDSFTHCLTDEDAVAALRSTAAALKPKGLLVLELAHPADYFSGSIKRTLTHWTQRHPDVVVRARFDSSERDAITETYIATMTIDARYRDGRAARRVRSRQLHRMWLRSAVANAAARSQEFDVVGWHGDVATRVPLTMKLQSWRMVAVLRRRP
jgi:SAM-dependent methyltransferase